MTRTRFTARRLLACAVLTATLGLTAGCTDDPDQAQGGQHTNTGGGGLPSPHVHGIAVNPGDGAVYLASHDGLFRYGPTGPQRISPVIDLMGFTVAGADHFYASGHPGQGTDLPNPVGLIESTDAGQTWKALSRQGQSDFHALTASSTGMIAGYDGTLAITTDRLSWEPRSITAPPYALATSTDAAVLLAATSTGLLRSTDAAQTWKPVPDAPPLVLVDWADTTVATGITDDGTIAVSTDTGLTWQRRGTAAQPQAIEAVPTTAGNLRIVIATEKVVLDSTDGGVTFGPLPNE